MPTETKSRYQQFKDILSAAAGDSPADYGGLGRFWELPHAKLLHAKLHGIELIAPENAGKSCCSHGAAGSQSRSARSGLVRALRALPPFDGSQFPRIPWGGKAVAEDDIQVIERWIDEGARESDRSETIDFIPARLVTVTAERSPERPPEGIPPFEFSASDVNDYMCQEGEPKQRMNLDCMTETQLEKFRYAMRQLYELNKWPEDSRNYNNLALIHQNHCQHGWERFLPWHRVYLYEFEQALQDHCPDVTVPYWDWTLDLYKPKDPVHGDIIPQSFRAFLRPRSLEFLQAAGFTPAEIEQLRPLVTDHATFTSTNTFFDKVGPDFSTGIKRNRLIDALLDANSLWYPLRYPAEYQDKSGKPITINQRVHYHYPTAEDMEQIMRLRTYRDFGGGSLYDDSFGFLDQNPHNTMHIWTGGQNKNAPSGPTPEDRNKAVRVAGRRFHQRDDLYSQPPFGDMFSNLTASYDPIFWPVHSNVDRIWWEWQQLHPNAEPADTDAILTPWNYTVRETLDLPRFGYEYVKCTYIARVGTEQPIGRFVSKSMPVPEPVRAAFERAEVRLHRVPQLPRSCFVRVFLNLPDANAATSLDDPHYAGYLAIFGHGACYGGPGHCDPPPPRARKFDLRPRSHNTPRNHRVNVTACAKRLIGEGAAKLAITLVVIGADYQEDPELLRLEGLSLNFLD